MEIGKPRWNPSYVEVGKDCVFHETAIISGMRGKISIGDNVLIGPFTTVVSWDHRFRDKSSLIRDKRVNVEAVDIRIGNDVWIGANCCVLKGSIIPDGCVIGAGSLVTRNSKLEPYSVYCGNPLRLIERREDMADVERKTKMKQKIKMKKKGTRKIKMKVKRKFKRA